VHCPMQLRKLASRGLVNAIATGQLVLITDQLSNRRFLVDTGVAFFSVSSFLDQLPLWPSLVCRGQPAYPILGGETAVLVLHWEGV
jgi:hypothetical protein